MTRLTAEQIVLKHDWQIVRDVASNLWDWGRPPNMTLAQAAVNAADILRYISDPRYTRVMTILGKHYNCAPLDKPRIVGGRTQQKSRDLYERACRVLKGFDDHLADSAPLAVAAE